MQRILVLQSAPFIDYPLVDLTSEDIAGWASILPTVKRTRSELHNGKQTLVTLDEPISRSYAGQALSLVRSCLNAAKNRVCASQTRVAGIAPRAHVGAHGESS